MTENEEKMENEQASEIEILLPKIIAGPIQLDDGSMLAVGEKVQHPTFGTGTVVRLSFSEKLGNLVYVDFASGKDEIVGASFLKKLN
jgi:hypothetical protein